MNYYRISFLALAVPIAMTSSLAQSKSFADDVAFLKKHVRVIVLSNGASAVALVPAWQGRVATSAFDAAKGAGNGWLNFEHISTGKFVPHINVFGGEDRFWIGPEGGQYSIFFKGGDPFDLAHWQTPPLIDTVPYAVSEQSPNAVTFRKAGTLFNYWGTRFDIEITRKVVLHDRAAVAKSVGVAIPAAVKVVGYETQNAIKNVGDKAWNKDTGLLSIWILGMLKHSATTTVVCPYRAGDEATMGPIVNDTYFGKVPANRLKIGDKAIYFRADGQMRTKIGLNPHRAMPACGSYDPARNLLTIVQYTKQNGATDYVNSMWEMQTNPYGGDVVNSYNDGPPAPGKKPLGPFYELETSSQAFALSPGKVGSHMQRTMHFSGSKADLDGIARKVLGVSLDEIVGAFK